MTLFDYHRELGGKVIDLLPRGTVKKCVVLTENRSFCLSLPEVVALHY